MLLENPKGDNRLDVDKLKKVCGVIFGTNNTQLRLFSGKDGEKLDRNKWTQKSQMLTALSLFIMCGLPCKGTPAHKTLMWLYISALQ